MSIPLLLERKTPGMGPKVPLRVAFGRIVVEGLNIGCQLILWADGWKTVVLFADVDHKLDPPLERGAIVQAEIVGSGSCVNVRLEPE